MEQIQGPARRKATVLDIALLQGAVLIFAAATLIIESRLIIKTVSTHVYGFIE